MSLFRNKDAGRSDGRAPTGFSKSTLGSKSYGRSKSKAADYLRDREKLTGLLDQATLKANGKKSRLKDVWLSLMSFFRLVRAYATGTYRQISVPSLLMIVASLIYFVSPIDLIPDFILGLGLIDDAALLAWTIKTCAGDLARFMEWERRQPNNQ